ncbi:MAG: SLC13 family permease [Gammaproteobacteria bacterium]
MFVVALAVLAALAPHKIPGYFTLVDWSTIATLLGLMILTKGIERSGWLHRIGRIIVAHIANERMLALFLVFGSALAAMLLTNDIALFVVVPLTLGLGELAVLPLRRLIIFEALAVNAGSMLTPIGNPQNIFLWQQSGVSFIAFMAHMLAPFLIANLCLLLLTSAAFSSRRIAVNPTPDDAVIHKPLLAASALLYLPFLVLADLHHPAFALALVAAVFLFAFPKLLRRIDWSLLAVFVLMFIDLGLLGQYPIFANLNLAHPGTLYVTGAVVSQAISNVPAAILLATHSADWGTIAWAVNVGALGLVIASLANLIALRLGRQPGSYIAFHVWSLPFFLVVGTLVWLWLRL